MNRTKWQSVTLEAIFSPNQAITRHYVTTLIAESRYRFQVWLKPSPHCLHNVQDVLQLSKSIIALFNEAQMDSSDDYIFDDIVLDDQTLAILDQSEQKHLKETSAAIIPGVPAEPVNKRLKTATGWIPGTGAAQTVEEELPEISLQGDGTYGVTRQARYMKDVGQGSFPRTRQINTPARASILSNDVGQAANQSTQSPGSHLPNSRSAYPINNRQRQQHATIYGQNHNRNSRVVKDQDSQRSPVLAQLTALQQKLDEVGTRFHCYGTSK